MKDTGRVFMIEDYLGFLSIFCASSQGFPCEHCQQCSAEKKQLDPVILKHPAMRSRGLLHSLGRFGLSIKPLPKVSPSSCGVAANAPA